MSDCRRPATGSGWSGARRAATLLAILGLCGVTGGCRVPPPKPEQLLRYGFGSPGQAFRSFATAVQGELLDPLYDSLSNNFKQGNGLSRDGFKQGWDGLISEQPLLRWALYQATKDPTEIAYERSPDGRACRVLAYFQGYELQVFLDKEGYWEIYLEHEDPALDPVRIEDRAVHELVDARPGGLTPSEDGSKVFLYVPTPEGWRERLAYIRGGYEWKVAGYQLKKLP